MKVIDLRSDTVTVPTPEMRQAMFEAVVGDDVYGEDPTINQLEADAAAVMGKEAGLFVPTGTQGNQISVLSHTTRGNEVIVESQSHIFFYEVAAIAVLAGCQTSTLVGVRGAMDPDAVEAAIRGEDIHAPRTGLVCLENTHNRAGGTILPQANICAIAEAAHRHGVPVHMDGARVFNAAAAQGLHVSEIVAPVDSVQFCLSKGLSAPVGSMVVGSKAFIAKARKNRKMLGGGMRQAGILAAAGLIALHKMPAMLVHDHANARGLATGIALIPGLEVDLETVQTNMVMVDVRDRRWTAPTLSGALARSGVLANAMGSTRIRLVTHKDVSAADVPEALDRIASVLKAEPDGRGKGLVYG